MASCQAASTGGGSSGGVPMPRVKAVVEADVVGHGLDDAAWVLVAEALQASVASPRIEREDGLERRVALSGRPPLLGCEGGQPHHADVAVTPGLGHDPLHGVEMVPVVVGEEVALALVPAPHLADDVHVAVGHEALGVPALEDAVPLGRPSRLSHFEVLCHLHPLQVLVVHRAGVENRELARGIRAVDVHT